MSMTQIADVQEQSQKWWAPLFVPELKETTVLPSLVDTDYSGEIKQGGDTVHISQFQSPVATRKHVDDVDADTFEVGKILTRRVSIRADQTITVGYDVSTLAELQSQIGSPSGQSEIRRKLVEAMGIEINNYLYSLVAPSNANPDHTLGTVTNFDAAQLLINRMLASQSYWPDQDRWLLVDPSYYNDLLSAQTLTSSDYVGQNPVVVAGKIVNQRFGFNIVEDATAGMRQISPTGAAVDLGMAFHRSFMAFVMQKQPEFKVSDLHATGKHGYRISVNLVCGAKLGLQGELKHITNYNL